MKRALFIAILFLLSVSCDNNGNASSTRDPDNDLTITTEVITQSFIGNGVQWGGYDLLESWTGNPTLSENDWEKLFNRVLFMRPPLIRIMVAPGWNYMIDDQFNTSKSEAVLLKILDFCQQEGIDVMFGEWGHEGEDEIDMDWLENSAKFIEWLLNDKGYSCIKYFNMVNEPNGDWSTINGNYSLWKSLIEQFHIKMVEKGIDSQVKIIGPDIAIWNNSLISWVNNTYTELTTQVNAYDIHTYPDEVEVRDGSYEQLVQAYRDAVPVSKTMLMGELGFKYAATSTLGMENTQRIASDKYASDDSNMFIYDSFYGIDMADAVIQNMRAGYAGSILWDMDDAMYNKGSTVGTKLKRWGFWNILGEEKFENPDDENIRPWFYPMSLLCRYFPKGTTIFQIDLPDKYGLRAIAGKKDGKYTIAIVNSHTVNYSVNLRMENGIPISDAKIYNYISDNGSNFTGNINSEGFAEPEKTGETIDLVNDEGKQLDMPAQSFLLITNMD